MFIFKIFYCFEEIHVSRIKEIKLCCSVVAYDVDAIIDYEYLSKTYFE